MDISALPELPLIEELSRALWRNGDLRGAAVMVGAGFSRNADRPGPTSQESPNWIVLAEAMQSKLGHRKGDTNDFLEIAQQYEAVFGRQALDGLIRDQVPDLSLQPGPLHRQLLRLPWSEVVTTNYDTLLERCAERSLGQTYEVVRSQSDIPRTRSPRIVKLHGSLPGGPFVVSSDDYRNYPRQQAAMVNLVQQVLLENHLVLIGFSATDPNFLAWTGWVRDNLGAAARRLFLVGLFDLSTGARRILESRGTAVIDLSPLVKGEDSLDRFALAFERFFTALENAKPLSPADWKLGRPKDISVPVPGHEEAVAPQHWFDLQAAQARLQSRIPGWAAERKNYPGWILAPSHVRFQIKASLADEPQVSQAIGMLPDGDRMRATFELAWKHDVAMLDFPDWLLREIDHLLRANSVETVAGRERFQAGVFALTAAREARDQTRFEATLGWLRETPTKETDLLAAVAYEEALWARDGLEFHKLPKLIEQIHGQDPIFLLRKAFLLCGLASFDGAEVLVSQALAELRQRRTRDRSSIWVLSRYGWALFLARQTSWTRAIVNTEDLDQMASEHTERWPSAEMRELHCDPYDELQSLDESISESERSIADQRVGTRPGFDAGSFTTRSFSRNESGVSPVGGLVTRIGARIGLPGQFDHSIILQHLIDRALSITTELPNHKLLQLCALLDRGDRGAIDRFLNRVAVASLPTELVRSIVVQSLSSIGTLLPYASSQTPKETGRSIRSVQDRIGVLLEIASRLVIRLPSNEAANVFARGMAWASDPRWESSWTSESLGHLLSRSMEAASTANRAAHVAEIADFPLPGEKNAGHLAQFWPEPSMDFKPVAGTSRPDTPLFANRLRSLTEHARIGSPWDRQRALLRLYKFQKAGVLTEEEIKAFASALWERVDRNALPADTSFRTFAFLDLPETTLGQAEAAIRAALLPPSGVEISEQFLRLLGAEETTETSRSPSFGLDPDEAVRCLDAILAALAAPLPKPAKQIDFFRNPTARWELLGAALAVGILPPLNIDTTGIERLNRLVEFIESRAVPSAAQAWPQIIRLAPTRHNQAVTAIIADLLSGDDERVNAALWAIERWRPNFNITKELPLPRVLLRSLVSLVATRSFNCLPGALRLVANCCQDKLLDECDVQLILTALEALIDETKTTNSTLENESAALRAGTLTLVRSEAARSALVMRLNGIKAPILERWIALIPDDPFPEVRSLLDEPALWPTSSQPEG